MLPNDTVYYTALVLDFENLLRPVLVLETSLFVDLRPFFRRPLPFRGSDRSRSLSTVGGDGDLTLESRLSPLRPRAADSFLYPTLMAVSDSWTDRFVAPKIAAISAFLPHCRLQFWNHDVWFCQPRPVLEKSYCIAALLFLRPSGRATMVTTRQAEYTDSHGGREPLATDFEGGVFMSFG